MAATSGTCCAWAETGGSTAAVVGASCVDLTGAALDGAAAVTLLELAAAGEALDLVVVEIPDCAVLLVVPVEVAAAVVALLAGVSPAWPLLPEHPARAIPIAIAKTAAVARVLLTSLLPFWEWLENAW